MVLGFIRDTLGPGTLVGFEKRWREIDAEESSRAKAEAKALRERIKAWKADRPMSSVISGDLKITAGEIPSWMDENTKQAYLSATRTATTRLTYKNLGEMVQKVADAELPYPNLAVLRIKIEKGLGTKSDKAMYRLFAEDPEGRLAKFGGVNGLYIMYNEKKYAKDRKRTVDDQTRRGVVGLHEHPAFSAKTSSGKRYGDYFELPKNLYLESSFFGGAGGATNSSINIINQTGGGTATTLGTMQAQKQFETNLNVLGLLDKQLGNDATLLQEAMESKSLKKFFSEAVDAVASQNVQGDTYHVNARGRPWVLGLYKNVATLLNSTVSSEEARNSLQENLQTGNHQIAKHKIPKGTFPTRGRIARNREHLQNSPGAFGSMNLMNIVTLNDTPASLKTPDAEAPLTGISYRNARIIRDSFTKFADNPNINTARTYMKTVQEHAKNILGSNTHIADMGKIYKQTAFALQAHALDFRPEGTAVIGGIAMPTEMRPGISVYDKNKYTHQKHHKILQGYTKRRNTYLNLERDIEGILMFMRTSDAKQDEKLDEYFSSTESNRVTGFSAELAQKLTTVGVEAVSTMTTVAEAIKSFFGSTGEGVDKDRRLREALDNKNLSDENKSWLETQAKRVGGLRRDGMYSKRAIIQFKKLALTYRLSGMVQGDSTGGRTISNQDFEVMRDALWGEQGAAKDKLSSLLQRVGTVRAIGEVERQLMLNGTFDVIAESQHLETLGTYMHNAFHEDLIKRTGGVTGTLPPSSRPPEINALRGIQEKLKTFPKTAKAPTPRNVPEDDRIVVQQALNEHIDRWDKYLGPKSMNTINDLRKLAGNVIYAPQHTKDKTSALAEFDRQFKGLSNMYIAEGGRKTLMNDLKQRGVPPEEHGPILDAYKTVILAIGRRALGPLPEAKKPPSQTITRQNIGKPTGVDN